MKKREPKAKPLRNRGSTKGDPDELNQATAAEFEREGMGVAPKE